MVPNTLPIQPTNFIGRRRELDETKRLLRTTRLLTLTGAGGVGKTRLALEAASQVLDQFADGVWLVELAPLSDEDLLPQTVAAALRLPEHADFDSKSSNSKSQLKEAKLDAMIAKARTLVDESERLQAYGEIQKYAAQQVYTVPIGGQYQFTMIQPRVQNYQVGSNPGEAVETYSKVWLKQ